MEINVVLNEVINVWKQTVTNFLLNMKKEIDFLQKSKIFTPENLHQKWYTVTFALIYYIIISITLYLVINFQNTLKRQI